MYIEIGPACYVAMQKDNVAALLWYIAIYVFNETVNGLTKIVKEYFNLYFQNIFNASSQWNR